MSSAQLLDEYLANLPEGLESYPALQQKASLYRNSMARNFGRLPLEQLPSAIAKLISEPIPVNGFVPLAKAHGFFIATRCYVFPDEKAFLADVAAIAVVLELAGGHGPQVELREQTASEARFAIRWR